MRQDTPPGFQFVIVGYNPMSTDLADGWPTILFDGPASRNFEALIEAGYTVPDKWAGRLQLNLTSDKVLDPSE